MKKFMFAVKDIKVGSFGNPFTDTDLVNAQRSFSIVVNQEGTQINAFPEDFELWKIGSFDVEKGKFINEDHALVTNGINCLAVSDLSGGMGRQIDLVEELNKKVGKNDRAKKA